METLEVGLFSKMKICSVVAAAVVLVCLGVGCSSVPRIVKYTGGEALEQCPKELGLDTGERSVALVSIETDLLIDEFYLLLEKDDGAKYLMKLSPRKLGMPTGGVTGHGSFKAKPFCYDIPPGNYHITKIIGVFRSTTPAGMSEGSVEYNHNRYCQSKGISLSDEQAASVKGIVCERFSILTGGPGCGKTTTTLVIVKLLEAMKLKVSRGGVGPS